MTSTSFSYIVKAASLTQVAPKPLLRSSLLGSLILNHYTASSHLRHKPKFAKVMADAGPTSPPWGLWEKLEVPVSESDKSTFTKKLNGGGLSWL